jgi:hypothetical protein
MTEGAAVGEALGDAAEATELGLAVDEPQPAAATAMTAMTASAVGRVSLKIPSSMRP